MSYFSFLLWVQGVGGMLFGAVTAQYLVIDDDKLAQGPVSI